MKILIVGGGGREHAIAWKIKQSRPEVELFCAPGNGGIAQIATLVSLGVCDVAGVTAWSKEQGMDLVIVAQDDPLAAGMVDALNDAGIRAFGPTKACAQIEWSKSYSKYLMEKYNIPTAASKTFDRYDEA